MAAELGERRRSDGISVVLTSDLRRAAETAEIAFAGTAVPILRDWRLRECNYGEGNGMPAARLHTDKSAYLDQTYPGGESWRQAVRRCASVVDDVVRYWEGQRVLIIGHVATQWALEYTVKGVPVEQLVSENFDWQLGWEYRLVAPS